MYKCNKCGVPAACSHKSQWWCAECWLKFFGEIHANAVSVNLNANEMKTTQKKRWTTQQKEIMGHKRKLANGMKVSLSTAPWEKDEGKDDRTRGATKDPGSCNKERD